MLNDNAKKWVAALRSGEYTQAQGLLSRENNFCCIGVACDLFAKENPGKGKWVPSPGARVIFARFMTDSGPHTSSMPHEVSEWLGMKLQAGGYTNMFGDINIPYRTTLVSLNDDQLKTFNEIADIIEVGGLFNA